jgi:hypothetical protein
MLPVVRSQCLAEAVFVPPGGVPAHAARAKPQASVVIKRKRSIVNPRFCKKMAAARSPAAAIRVKPIGSEA